MSDESTKKYVDAYNLFASWNGIETKGYDCGIYVTSIDGDAITIKPHRSGVSEVHAVFRDAVKKIFRECVQEQLQALSEYKESLKHPGMERFNSEREFWEEVDRANQDHWDEVKQANGDARAAEIEAMVRKCVAEALR